jgi:hypothetical protein
MNNSNRYTPTNDEFTFGEEIKPIYEFATGEKEDPICSVPLQINGTDRFDNSSSYITIYALSYNYARVTSGMLGPNGMSMRYST